MKIKNFSLYKTPFELKEPYTIAYQTVSNVENIFLKVDFDNNISSLGVCSPEEEVTGETIDSCFNILQEEMLPLFASKFKAESALSILDQLKERYPNYPTALASIDFALFKALASHQDKSLSKYLGQIQDEIKSTITINILSPEDTLNKAIFWLKSGFSMLKIKGGINLEEDLRKLFLLKQKLSTLPPILFDANQGYSYEEAMFFLRESKSLELIAVEQPVNKFNKEELISLANQKITPIMADESACSIDDVNHLSKAGVQYINVKLMKCGGILQGLRLIAAALQNGSNVILSCMDECALSNAYSLCLSTSFKEIKFVDLDSFTDYLEDPTAEYMKLQNGNLSTIL